MATLSLPPTFAAELARRLPRPTPPTFAVRPVQVLYGGAHLFRLGTPEKLAKRAAEAMTAWGDDDVAFGQTVGVSDPEIAREVARRVRTKVGSPDSIESICIDFEDGFGPRPDEEEDGEALRTAEVLAQLPAGGPIVGIRIKGLAEGTLERALRTLDLFLTRLVARRPGLPLPRGFTVTLPKVGDPATVSALVLALTRLESALGLPDGARVAIELMIETPRALVDERGSVAIPALVEAGAGRVKALHLGAYDLTAELGVTAGDQRLDHPLCDLARGLLQLSSTLPVSDGATTTLPTPAANAPREEQRRAVHTAWALHARNVTRAIDVGIWQGWDLHPAQLPARYGAIFAHFATRRTVLGQRLSGFLDRATQATRLGQIFDDAATGQGLVSFFRRGLACGALDDDDLHAAGVTREELEAPSFEAIVTRRRA